VAWTESSSEDRVSFSYDGPGRDVVDVSYARGGELGSFVAFGILVLLAVSLARYSLLVSFVTTMLCFVGMLWASRRSRMKTKRSTEDHFVITISSRTVLVTSIQGTNRSISLEHVMSFVGDRVLRVAMRDGSQQVLPIGKETNYAELADAMNIALRRIQAQHAGYRGPSQSLSGRDGPLV
jgi:hypothetical protein